MEIFEALITLIVDAAMFDSLFNSNRKWYKHLGCWLMILIVISLIITSIYFLTR